MKTRTDRRTPEQRANSLESTERILDWLSRRGLLLLAAFLLGLGGVWGLLDQGESALGPWHGGYATGKMLGLFMAAMVVAACQLLVECLRRSVQDDRASLLVQGGETDA